MVALGIASSDRREAKRLRHSENRERNAVMEREAALVRVAWEPATTMRTFGGDRSTQQVTLTNRRDIPIFDVEVVAFTQEDGSDVAIEMTGYMPLPLPEGANMARRRPIPSHLVIEPTEYVGFFVTYDSNKPMYVAVAYTDQRGHRWRVDSRGDVDHITDTAPSPAVSSSV